MTDLNADKSEETGGLKTAILCVDADRNSNAAIGRRVAGDADLWEAFNFKTAIEAIKRRPFGLVICDVTAAEVGGMDVLSILADLYPSTPVFVTSAPGIAGWTSEAFQELGAFAGMMKPYNLQLLRLAINEALWSTPVMGRGDVGRAVLTNAAIHETAAEELSHLSDEQRGEIRSVAEVLERIMPFQDQSKKRKGDYSQ